MGPFCSFIDSHLRSGIRLFSLQEALVPFSRNSTLDNNPVSMGIHCSPAARSFQVCVWKRGRKSQVYRIISSSNSRRPAFCLPIPCSLRYFLPHSNNHVINDIILLWICLSSHCTHTRILSSSLITENNLRCPRLFSFSLLCFFFSLVYRIRTRSLATELQNHLEQFPCYVAALACSLLLW